MYMDKIELGSFGTTRESELYKLLNLILSPKGCPDGRRGAVSKLH